MKTKQPLIYHVLYTRMGLKPHPVRFETVAGRSCYSLVTAAASTKFESVYEANDAIRSVTVPRGSALNISRYEPTP